MAGVTLLTACDPPRGGGTQGNAIARLRAEWNPTPDLTGKTVHFTGANSADKYLISGWSRADADKPFRWSEGHVARISLPVRRYAGPLVVKFTMGGLVAPPALRSQRVAVVIHGRTLAELQVSDSSDFEILVPAEVTNGWTELQIELQLPDAASPQQLGHSPDRRQLGIYLSAIAVDRQS